MNKTKFQQQLEELLKQYEKEELSRRVKRGLAQRKKGGNKKRSSRRK